MSRPWAADAHLELLDLSLRGRKSRSSRRCRASEIFCRGSVDEPANQLYSSEILERDCLKRVALKPSMKRRDLTEAPFKDQESQG